MKRVLVAAGVLLFACSSEPDNAPDAATPASDRTIPVFTGTHVYFGAENMRTVDVEVTLPDAQLRFDRVTLDLALGCPNDRCDWWDRLGWLALVRNPGAEDELVIEIARFITPYRVAGAWSLDVSELLSILRGTVTIRVFIDTWVGPGHSNGDGWLVDASLVYRGGIASPNPYQVIPLLAPQGVVYGDPARPAVLEVDAAVEPGARAARLRSLITGHGQGSADNCAEFCEREHTFTVNGEAFARKVWRDDCQQTAVPNQQGTWTYPRAGWCPGALVTPRLDTLGDAPTTTVSLDYGVEAYENTCRPDAPTCTGCVAGGCDYNGSSHTEPRYQVSAQLILYR